jgi:hypothetical protein
MQKFKVFFSVLFISIIYFACTGSQENKNDNPDKERNSMNQIQLINNESRQKVDVLVDGELFTSYLYTDTLPVLKKTVLYPIVSANGVAITRGYPLDPRPGERTDHPHHIGAWLNYGDVNGLDFWNNSDAIPEERKNEMGIIRNEKIVSLKNDGNQAELTVRANWLKPDGSVLLKEETSFAFIAKDSLRIIDRKTILTALDETVLFKDNKEGMIGIRMARQLELPSDKPVTLSDAHGNKTEVKKLDNTGVSGNYLSSEGIEGKDVWGKRAKWVALSGTIDSKELNVVIMDNPKNIGYPTYWHARGYGLFAANPLGQKIFSEGKEELNFTLKPKENVTFEYRIEIINGKPDKEFIETEYLNFINP